MKNLRKILMALALVVVLISSIVTVAIADTAYTGTVTAAQALLDNAVEANPASGDLSPAKATHLKTVYSYLKATPIDPEADGYDELVTAYNRMTMKVAYYYLQKALTCEGKEKIGAALAELHAYIAAAPAEKLNGKYSTTIMLGYKCADCGAYSEFNEAQLYAASVEGLSCPADCGSKKNVTLSGEYTYDQLTDDINDVSFAHLGVLLDALFSAEEDGGYYTLLDAQKTALEFLDIVDEKAYSWPDSKIYTGDIADAVALLPSADGDVTLEQLKTGLAATYAYLTTTPVNPTTDEYCNFIIAYNDACDLLVEKYAAAVDAADSAADKVTVLVEFHTYLTGAEAKDDTEAVKATPLSQNTIAGFNELRDKVIAVYTQGAKDVTELEKLVDVKVPAKTYASAESFAAFKKNLDTIDKLLAENPGDAYVAKLIENVYSTYASKMVFDPSTEGYAELIAQYNRICAAYVKHAYVDAMADTSVIGEKYSILVSMYSFVSATPLSEAVVDMYNDARETLLAEATLIGEKVSADNLPVYVEEAKKDATVTDTILYSFVEKLRASYNEYISAEAGEDKASALEKMKTDAAGIYAYIIGSTVDTEADYYAAFAAEYNAVRNDVIEALLSTVDGAKDDAAKLAALTSLGEYLKGTPLSKAAIDAYNTKVDKTVTDAKKAAAMKLDSGYSEVEKLVKAALAEGASTSTVVENAALIKAALNGTYDVTDPAYVQLLTDYDAVVDIVADTVYDEVTYAIANLSAAEIAATIDAYRAVVDAVCEVTTVESFVKAVKVTADTCASVIDKIENNYATVAVCQNSYVAVYELVEKYDSAESLEERLAAFAELETYLEKVDSTVFVAGDSYALVAAERNEIAAAVEAELIAHATSSLSPERLHTNMVTVRDFIVNTTFSDEVVAAYNKAIDMIAEEKYPEKAVEVKEDTADATYVVPEEFTPNLARIKIAINLAKGGETVSDEFYVAYKILCGLEGINGPQAVDFGVSGFEQVIIDFNEVKTIIVNEKLAPFEDGSDSEADTKEESEKEKLDPTSKAAIAAKHVAFDALGEFIDAYPFSSKMVDTYNEVRLVLNDAYAARSEAMLKAFENRLDSLHTYLETCPINESLLTGEEKTLYNAYKNMITAAEYKQISGYIESFDTTTGEMALIYQNNLIDRLNWYMGKYSLGSCNDSMLANANLKVAFMKYLSALDNELATMDDKADRIDFVGAYLVVKNFPEDLVTIFNNRYEKDITANVAEKGDGVGTLVEFGEYISKFDSATTLDEMRYALAFAVEYMLQNPLSTTNVQPSTLEMIGVLNQKVVDATEEQKKIIDQYADLSEYDLEVQQDWNHENSKLYKSSLSANADGSGSIEIASDGTNKYAKLTVTSSRNPYFDLKVDGTNGLVIEMDLMSPETLNFKLAFTEDGLNTGARVTTNVLDFTGGQLKYIFGDYSPTRDDQGYPNYQEGVNDPIVAVPGQWIHITLVMDVDNQMMELLIDYVSLGKKPIITGSSSQGEDSCLFTSLRFQSTNTYSTTCYDNLKVYAGTSYRILDKFASMNTDDMFKYYVDYANDEAISSINRMFAYYAAEELLPYVSTACDEYKTKFEDFKESKVSQIQNAANEDHIANLEDIAANIDIDNLNIATMSEMRMYIDSATNYIASNSRYIIQSDERFISIQTLVNAANARVVWLENLNSMLDCIARFNRATTYASLTRHYEDAYSYYQLCELNKEAYAVLADADPKVVECFEQMLKDEAVSSLVSSSLSVGSCFSEYMPTYMTRQLYYENSIKMLDCIGFIEALVTSKEELTEEAYREALLAAASANSDYVDPYLTVIRSYVTTNTYDESVEGIDRAIELFELLDGMFFEALQKTHFEIIKAQLDRYVESESYIEKAGICTFIENYIATNDVDMSSVVGAQYLYALDVYKRELETYIDDYEAILEANTYSFIGAVDKMQSYVTYAELKPLYDEIINNYYYSMNVSYADNEELQTRIDEALRLFAEYEAKIEEWELNGAMLVGYADTLSSARRQSHIFRALVNCSKYVDSVDESVEGVSEAISIYNEMLAEYNESTAPINDEISEVNDVVCSVRSNSIVATVLAVIKGIIG